MQSLHLRLPLAEVFILTEEQYRDHMIKRNNQQLFCFLCDLTKSTNIKNKRIMQDIEVLLENKPGTLALMRETLDKNKISHEGGGVFQNEKVSEKWVKEWW